MQTRQGVLRQLDQEWERMAESLYGRRAVRGWGAGEPLFDGVRSLGALVERINERGRAEESDAIILVLLRHAAEDDLAARTVLQAMMPAIKNLTSKFSTCGAWSAEETAAVVVAAMWERIRTYPIERRPRKVAANLALDTRQRVWRSGHKLVYGRLPPRAKAA
jgi:hypothetical protein